MLDLFDMPILPGLSSVTDLVTGEEERALIARIDALDLTPFRFQQWQGKRLTYSFGWHYDFQTGAVQTAESIPAWLEPVVARASAFAGLATGDLSQVLLTRYDPGAGIGWHRDRPIYEHVVGISLGAAAEMRFRRQVGSGWQRASLPLDPRGGYHLTGTARHDWEHGILPLARTRYSITMRSFKMRR